MALAIPTTAVGAWTGGGNLVITKPVGLSVGDLMVAWISYDSGTTTSPAGWTTQLQKSSTGGNIAGRLDWVIATTTEVAATNFTWTGSAQQGGSILRITGNDPVTPIQTTGFDTTVIATSTPSFNSSVTPTNPNSLILFGTGAFNAVAGVATSSGYAVVTDNPTWTEQQDNNLNGGGIFYQGSFASALRVQTTATGNASLTMSNLNAQYVNIMAVVAPAPSAAGTTTHNFSLLGVGT